MPKDRHEFDIQYNSQSNITPVHIWHFSEKGQKNHLTTHSDLRPPPNMGRNAETALNCSREQLANAIRRLNEIYARYCPTEHILCKYLGEIRSRPAPACSFSSSSQARNRP
jgi:hypothetical protein